jgi:hypothetical protein
MMGRMIVIVYAVIPLIKMSALRVVVDSVEQRV